jgi:hypothetical protein
MFPDIVFDAMQGTALFVKCHLTVAKLIAKCVPSISKYIKLLKQ